MNERRGTRRHACPGCLRDDGLWENVMVDGWHEVDAFLRKKPGGERSAEWIHVHPEWDGGCAHCEWRGSFDLLVNIGLDGKPLPHIHRDQLEFEDAA